MTYTPDIFDWRTQCPPIDQVFRAGGESIQGGATLGGFLIGNPEPGGRGELHMRFAPFATEEANLAASWTVSRITNGAVMRIRLWRTVQLVTESALNVPDTGQTWSNGEPWSNDENWRANPFAPVAAAAAKGAASFTVDMSILGEILMIGHVVGFFLDGYDFTHVVQDISYDTGVATVTVSPPLRRALATTDFMLFRPTMLVQCLNAFSVMSNFRSGRHMALNDAVFTEALV